MSTYTPSKSISEMTLDEQLEHARRQNEECKQFVANIKKAAQDVEDTIRFLRAKTKLVRR